MHLRILRARKLKETEIWQRPQGREGHRPFAPWRVENSNSISKLLLPSTIYLVLDLIAHPASCARGKAPRSGLRAATPVRPSTGEGAGEGEGEYGVGEIINKRVAKDSGSKTRTDLVPRKGPASSPTPIWSRRTWKAAPSTSARARAR